MKGIIENLYVRIDENGNTLNESLNRRETPKKILQLIDIGIEYSQTWYNKNNNIILPKKDNRDPKERAILCQSKENYQKLQENFPQIETLSSPYFGENLYISGILEQNLCIGDIFNIIREENNTEKIVGILQVANPRRPCFKIKRKHTWDVCFYCAHKALAGWFFRVLQEGSICIGDKIILQKRIHPTWNLKRLSTLMYSETNLSYKIPRWKGTECELNEILQLKELADFRWKDVLKDFVANRKERELKWEQKQEKNDE